MHQQNACTWHPEMWAPQQAAGVPSAGQLHRCPPRRLSRQCDRRHVAGTRCANLQPASCKASRRIAVHAGSSSLPYEQEPQKEQEVQTSFLPVPWGISTVIGVVVLWFLWSFIVSCWITPIILSLIGKGTEDLTLRGQAFLHLVHDLNNCASVPVIFAWQLGKYQPLKKGWFQAPLRPVRRWLGPVIVAAPLLLVVNWIANHPLVALPDTEVDLFGQQVLEQSLASGDTVTKAIYFVVLIFCAPFWEEAIFRGFLLPSLIRSMAPWTALMLSSIMFALVHFAKQRCIPLAVLGVIKGILYMQTRNLLAPFTLHALWNLFQFIITVQAQ